MTKRTSKTTESKQVELIEDDLDQVTGGASGVPGVSVAGGGVPGTAFKFEPAFKFLGGGVPGKPLVGFKY